MRNDVKISIIVPVYNTGNYLKQCIESVLFQTYSNIELILVNDGSKDSSSVICDDYAESDARVKVIHKENGGLSSARNAGINAASGEYIIFLDSDDYWDDFQALTEIVTLISATSADVIVWNLKKQYSITEKINHSRRAHQRVSGAGRPETLLAMVKSGRYNACACDKAVKRELIINNNLFFEFGVFSEDVEWAARLAVCASEFIFYDNMFYIYRQRANSITKTVAEKNIADLKKHFISCYELVKNIDSNMLYRALMGYCAIQYANTLITISKLKNSSRHIKNIKQYVTVLDSAISIRPKIINMVIRCVGLKITVRLLHMTYGCLQILRRV